MNEITLKKIIKHFNKICKHKFYVLQYCIKLKIPIRGITHDLSKFSLTEFWENVRYYQEDHSPIVECKKEKGYSRAWLHHKGRNTHHYEYYLDYGFPHIMPFKDSIEMLCDYIGAAKAYMGNNFSYQKEWEWFQNKYKNKDFLLMHKVNLDFISLCLYHMKQTNKFISYDFAKSYYNMAFESYKKKGE